MAVPEVSGPANLLQPAGARALDEELDRERSIVRAGMLGIVIAAPFTVAITIGMMAIAMSSDEPWYIWVGLGAAIGTYAALFFGSITGTLLTAHRLDHAEAAPDSYEAAEPREEATAATG